jgi:alpha-tubulin suppressor-like RCC1 family protein
MTSNLPKNLGYNIKLIFNITKTKVSSTCIKLIGKTPIDLITLSFQKKITVPLTKGLCFVAQKRQYAANLLLFILVLCFTTGQVNAQCTTYGATLSSASTTICAGASANLTVTIYGGTGPYTVVYFNGTGNTTVNNYTSGSNIPVSPAVTTTYSLISVTDALGCKAGIDWIMVSAGMQHSLGIKADGTLWAWGTNANGSLGDGTTTVRYSPIQIGTVTNWSSVAAFGNSSIALKTDGTLWSWGDNTYGQLGDGTTTQRLSPVQIGSATTWASMSAKGYHVLARRTNGTIWAWGGNFQGAVGDGTITQRNSPVQTGGATDWASVSAGNNCSFARKTNGTLWAWGNNSFGQLGDGSFTDRHSPIQIGSATNWASIAPGSSYATMAIKTDGTRWAWGSNGIGEYGNGLVGIGQSTTPIQIGAATDWASIFVNSNFQGSVFAIKTNGTLWAWGNNSINYQLGDGTTTQRPSPVQIGSATNWASISGGLHHTLGLQTNGSLWGWGSNANGVLGGGSPNPTTTPFQTLAGKSNTITVTAIPTVGAASSTPTVCVGTPITDITHTTSWAFGIGTPTGLPSGVTASYSANTITISGTPTVIGTYTYSIPLLGCATVPATGTITVTPLTGVINTSGAGSSNPTLCINTPLTNITFATTTATGIVNSGVSGANGLPAGVSATWASDVITISGTPLVSGTFNYNIPLSGGCGAVFATGTITVNGAYAATLSSANGTVCAPSPANLTVAIYGGTSPYTVVHSGGTVTGYTNGSNIPVSPAATTTYTLTSVTDAIGCKALIDWKMIKAGNYQTVGIKANGTLWAWGRNDFNQLGDGTTTQSNIPKQIGVATNWASIAAGGVHTIAIKTDGTLWAWGYNFSGQLGDGTTINKSTPTQIGTATNWGLIAAGANHTLAIKTDGTLWAWGYNAWGQLGDNSTIDKTTPTQIGTASNWASIAGGGSHTIARKTDGTLWAWGLNNSSQLGDGTTTQSNIPKQIGVATNWASVSAGNGHTIATRTNGTLWAWGWNIYGQLGDGTTATKTSPIQIGSATNWASIAAGGFHTIATRTDGTLWAWGYNNEGTLGDGTNLSKSSPVQIGAATNWAQISAGYIHTVATTTTGTLLAWGYNFYGQVGDATTVNKNIPVQIVAGSSTTIPILAPATVVATAGSSATCTSFSANWTTSTESFTYFLDVSTLNTFASFVTGFNNLNVGNVGTYTVTGLTAGVTYYYRVRANNPCGTSVNSGTITYATSPATPAQPGVITGTVAQCPALTSQTYSITAVTNATTYNWTVPAGWSITAGAGTTSITVTTGTAGQNGNISVTAQNSCGISAARTLAVTVSAATPAQPGVITGTAAQCPVLTSQTYSITAVPNATTYNWTVPTGWSITAGAGTTSITVTTGTAGQNGNISVTAQNSCGTSAARTLAVTVSAASVGGTVTGSASVCSGTNTTNLILGGQTGTVTRWESSLNNFATAGTTIANTSTTLTVTNLTTTTSYRAVVSSGACAAANSASATVTVRNIYAATLSSGNATICAGTSANLTVAIDGGTSPYTVVYSGGTVNNYINGSNITVSPASTTTYTLTSVTDANGCNALIDWKMIKASSGNGAGIKAGGTLWTWGGNSYGQLGDASIAIGGQSNIPLQIGTANNWESVEVGGNCMLAKKTDGTIWAWGDNQFGQLGDGGTVNKNIPTQIGSATDWASISVQNTSAFAIKTNGTLWAWGANSDGQLGDGTTTQRNSPVQIGVATNWASVSSGISQTLARQTDGTLWAWGNNTYGQLGDNTTVNKTTPTKIGVATDWASVTSGWHQSLAIKTNGTLWAWGRNHRGQLGDGSTTQSNIPKQIGVATNWASVQGGIEYSIGRQTNGTLWAWGSDFNYMLGDGGAPGSAPTQLNVPTQIGSATNWALLDEGYQFALATKTDGTIWAWGSSNFISAWGSATPTSSTSPVQTVAAKSSTITVTALPTVGAASSTPTLCINTPLTNITHTTTWTLGIGTPTGLPPGVTASYSANTITISGTPTAIGTYTYSIPLLGCATVPATGTITVTVPGGVLNTSGVGSSTPTLCINTPLTNITFATTGATGIVNNGVVGANGLPAGVSATWASDVITISGTPVVSGIFTYNIPLSGGCGAVFATGTITVKDNYAATLSSANATICAGTPANLTVAISGGTSPYTVVYSGGTVTGYTSGSNIPVSPASTTTYTLTSVTDAIGCTALIDWKMIKAGDLHTVGIKADGTLWTWGYNNKGQLGDGTIINKTTPTQIGVATNWASVTAGNQHTIATKTDGTLWAWGDNAVGQLGDGTTTDKLSPTQIGVGTNWALIAAGVYHTIATKTDGTLWAWGWNAWGQLGDNTTTQRNSPVQIGSATNWGTISAGSQHNLARKTDGTLWGWGLNSTGQLGDGTVINKTTPTQIGSATNWASIVAAAGYDNSGGSNSAHSLATKTDGTLWAWGRNTIGQLGDGTQISRLNGPIQIGTATNWASVAAGLNHSIARKTTGELWSWGWNIYRQLGDGTTNSFDINPKPIAGGATNWVSLSAGLFHNVATKTDGSLWAWGRNNRSQLGDGTTVDKNIAVQIVAGKSTIITVSPASVGGTATAAAATICSGNSTTITLTGNTGSTIQWQQSANGTSGWVNVTGGSGGTTATYTTPNLTSTTYYRAVVTSGSCAAANSATATILVTIVNTWAGITTNWNDNQNWCSGVPAGTANVTIPSGVAFYPIITDRTVQVNNITIASGASVTLNNGELSISGTISNSGSLNATNGSITLNGTVADQSISGSMFVGNTIKNLKISNSNGVSLGSVNDMLKLTGILNFGTSNAVLTTNGNLTLVSNAAATACVADMTNNGANSGNDIIGNVTVERYIPNQPKAWRFLSTPTSGQTIKNAWMEGNAPLGNNKPGYGAIITSNNPGALSLGFDIQTASNSGPSMKTYNPATGNWNGVANTNTQMIANKKGYMILIRGDRSVTAFNQAATATTLRTTGQLYTRGVNAPAPSTVLPGKMESIGNPYAAEIDFTLLTKTGSIDNTFYVWDPLLTVNSNGLGGYQTISATNGWKPTPGGTANYDANVVCKTIKSGYAFFVFSSGGGGTVSFTETAKTNSLVTRQQNQHNMAGRGFLRTNLFNAAGALTDGNVVAFDQAFSNEYDGNDALKLINATENLGIQRDTNNLSVEARSPVNTEDTVFYTINNMRAQAYRLKFMPENMNDANVSALLVDRFLNTTTAINLNDSTVVNFSITANTASAAANRFYLVFKPIVLLPVTITGISAGRNSNGTITVNWKSENETAIEKYELERGGDGRNFSRIKTVLPVANNGGRAEYTEIDTNPLSGNNFYRIKAISTNGLVQYSNIAKVADIRSEYRIAVFPNPVINKTINISFSNQSAGRYIIQLINALGQTTLSKSEMLDAAPQTKKIFLGNQLPSGNYQLKIIAPDGKTIVTALVVD